MLAEKTKALCDKVVESTKKTISVREYAEVLEDLLNLMNTINPNEIDFSHQDNIKCLAMLNLAFETLSRKKDTMVKIAELRINLYHILNKAKEGINITKEELEEIENAMNSIPENSISIEDNIFLMLITRDIEKAACLF